MDNKNDNAVTEPVADEPVSQPVKAKDTYVHTFVKPFKWEGTEYKTLNFYFGKLTADDMIAAEREILLMQEPGREITQSPLFNGLLAARAANIGFDMMRKIPFHDFKLITLEAQLFQLG
jgi:hypothetical protein